MVLLVHHGGHALQLTGDLEGPGRERVLATPPPRLAVLRASRRLALALEPYRPRGATYLATWEHGAVTVRSQASGLVVETFRSGQRWKVRAPARP
jgi:beta-lactamase superfamily II metal-dependent hydrolase